MATVRYCRPMTEPIPVIIVQPKKPEPSKGAKITAGIITAIIAIGCLIGGIAIFSGGSKTTTSSPASAPTTLATVAATGALPDQMICQLDVDGGTFYLLLTSASDHNFSACKGATPYSGTIDQLLTANHGVDRRCFLNNAFIAKWDASGGVYSDTKKADLAAERDYCSANGTN